MHFFLPDALFSTTLSQLDLQENGSYTVFVCPSASTVFLLLCCCANCIKKKLKNGSCRK